jgi:twitching motility protein PilT
MADRRSNALDDDSFPAGLFRAGQSDRHTTDASNDVGSAGGDADLFVPGADELFPPLPPPAPIDDDVDAVFEAQPAAGGDAHPSAPTTAASAAPRDQFPPEEPAVFVRPKPFPLPRPIPALNFVPPPADPEPAAAPPSAPAAPVPPAAPAAQLPPPRPATPASPRPSVPEILRAIDALSSRGAGHASPARSQTAPEPPQLREPAGEPIPQAEALPPTPPLAVPPSAPAPLVPTPPAAPAESDRIEPLASSSVDTPEIDDAPPFELTAFTGSIVAPDEDANEPEIAVDDSDDHPRLDFSAAAPMTVLDLPVLAIIESAPPDEPLEPPAPTVESAAPRALAPEPTPVPPPLPAPAALSPEAPPPTRIPPPPPKPLVAALQPALAASPVPPPIAHRDVRGDSPVTVTESAAKAVEPSDVRTPAVVAPSPAVVAPPLPPRVHADVREDPPIASTRSAAKPVEPVDVRPPVESAAPSPTPAPPRTAAPPRPPLKPSAAPSPSNGAASTTPQPTPAASSPIRRVQAEVREDPPAASTRIAAKPVEPADVRPPAESAAPSSVSSVSMERLTNLDDLLRLAASCGASTLYLAPQSRPSVRVGGEVWVLEDIPILETNELDALLFALKLAHNADAAAFAGGEWTFDLPGAGRIRCMAVTDQRGPGAVFRIVPSRTVAADQLGLSLEIQALTLERDGLILVSGPRSSGKSAVISGLLDLINRTRQAYIVIVQREVNATWEGERAFISQREARGGLDDLLAVARAAQRENPDVLVLQEVRSAALMSLALEAAASGQLVIAGYTARTAPAAIAGLISQAPFEQRRSVQLALSQHLRGVIAQTLIARPNGGRAAARELMLNTPPIAAALAEGKTWQLALAMEAGRNHGMVTMNEALLDLVQHGIVAAEDAYRQAPEPMVFVDALKRLGIDTSFTD